MPVITHKIPGYPTGRAVFPGDVPAVLSFPGIVVRRVSGNPRRRLGICQFTVRFLVPPSETPPPGNSRHPGPKRPSRHRNPQQAVGEPCSAAPVDWFSAVRISIADFLADASFSPLCSRSGASAGHLCPRRVRSQRRYLRDAHGLPVGASRSLLPRRPSSNLPRCPRLARGSLTFVSGATPDSSEERNDPTDKPWAFSCAREAAHRVATNVTIPRASRGHSQAAHRCAACPVIARSPANVHDRQAACPTKVLRTIAPSCSPGRP